MPKLINFVLVAALMVLTACNNYDGREMLLVAAPIPPTVLPQPPAPPVNISGTWYSRAENNAVNCGSGEYVDGKSVVISQDSVDISMLLSSGDSFTGTVNGDIVEWAGSFPERNGMTDFTSTSMVFSADSGAGNAMWTWSDGSDSCNGSMALSFDRNAASESDRNSRPEIADQFQFVDNVAFFTGTLGVGSDRTDFFTFTADQDAMLQVELAHFDSATTNLDLRILDENLQEIAASTSASDFEMVDVGVSGGTTYFVQVDATLIAGVETYDLVLDIN